MDPAQNPNPYHHPNLPSFSHHHHPYPPPPHPNWPPPPPPPQQHHMPPAPAPHYQAHTQPVGPYGPPIQPQQYHEQVSWPQYPPPPPPPHQPQQYSYINSSSPAPAPPSGYAVMPPQPRPSQGWGSPSPSWAPYQGWENPGYSNEEDLAARAKAWAASQSASANHLVHSQVTTVGRAEEHNISVHGSYQSAAGPHAEAPSFSQINNQQTSYLMDQQKQANQLNGTASYTPTSFSFGTGGLRGYDARDSGITAQVASPPKSFASNSSIYEQEVPYSYSLPQGQREAGGHNDTFQQSMPLPAFSVQEGAGQSNSTLTDSHTHTSAESHYAGHPNTYVTDAANKPLDFERPVSDFEHRAKINYAFTDPAGSMGVMDHNTISAPVNSWVPSAVPGNFPQAVVSSGIQYDLPFASQSSLAVHPPAFGGLSGPSFGPVVPPVPAPFGLVAGASLNQSTSYSADVNGAFSLPERPKKPAVPKWIQEEIIKNKSVIASTMSSHHNGISYNSVESEDSDKPYRKDDQDDIKSFDSTKSSKDDEDDEDEVALAKAAATNQEIKRILTEVLMKVTDELFNEIATKVISEDDQTVEVNMQNDPGKHKIHLPLASVPNAPAKATVPVKEDDDLDSSKSPGGDVLGLASYASDEEENNEDQDSKLAVSDMIVQHTRSEDKIDAEKADKSDRGNHNGGLRNIEGERENNGETVFKESAVSTKVADSSKQSVSTNVREKEVKSLPEIGKKYTPSNVPVVDTTSQDERRSKSTVGDANDQKVEFRTVVSNRISSSNKHSEVRTSDEDSIRKRVAGRERKSGSSETADNENKNKMKMQKGASLEADDKISKHAKSQKIDSGKGEDNRKHEKRESVRDKKERSKEDSPRKRQKGTYEKERSRRASDSGRYSSSRRSSSPSSRGRTSRTSSTHVHGSGSSDEPSDNTKRRKLHQRSSSPSPTRDKSRHVSRSPNRKHSHRRHSPYSSGDKRRRSRSGTPVHRRR